MKRRSLFTLLGLAATVPALATTGRAQPVLGANLTMSSMLSAKLHYLAFLPRSYSAKGEGVPLIVFLHGSGERGADLGKVKAWGPPAIAEKNPDFPFMVVSPQCPEGEQWHALSLKAMLDDVLARYNVDKRRVYLTGLSMGGYGAWDLACRYPQYFAALAPICGGGIARLVRGMSALPTWVFHGKKDDVVPEEESARMVEALKAAGGNVKYTVLPEAGHVDAWVHAYGEAGLFDWFRQQVKG